MTKSELMNLIDKYAQACEDYAEDNSLMQEAYCQELRKEIRRNLDDMIHE